MKKSNFLLLFVFATLTAFAQQLPDNPEPGKCYVRCKTPDLWKNEDVKVLVKPEYSRITRTYPATYKTVEERVLIKEASVRYDVVPAVYETKRETIVIKEASSVFKVIPAKYTTKTISYEASSPKESLRIIPAKFSKSSEEVEIKAATATWQMSDKAPDCESSDPNDCRYWCYVPVAPEYRSVAKQRLVSDARTQVITNEGSKSFYKERAIVSPAKAIETKIPAVTKVVERRVLVSPAKTVKTEIPAEYKTITKTVKDKESYSDKVTVPAEYRTISKEVLVTKGGLTTWKEVDCKLLENTLLPINWNFNSAVLTTEAKRIIDTHLLPILKDGVSAVIESHTDSRGSGSSNQELSERRALAVTNYLISKGVNSSQLTGLGLGETKLMNRCGNGVSCTEKEHRQNRRTTFRVINQK